MSSVFVVSPEMMAFLAFATVMCVAWAFWGVGLGTGKIKGKKRSRPSYVERSALSLPQNEGASTAKMASQLSGLIRFVMPKRLNDVDEDDMYEKLLVSGNPFNVSSPAEMKGVQLAFAVVFSVIFMFLGFLLSFNFIITGGVGALIGYLLPSLVLKQDTAARSQAVKKYLPEALDLISVAMKAGLTFAPALREVVKTMPESAMRDALAETVRDLDAGVSTELAMRRLSRKFESPELDAFTKAIVLAQETGADVVGILEKQSEFARDSYESEVQQRVGKLESTIFFIVIMFEIMPFFAMLVIVPIYEMNTSGAF